MTLLLKCLSALCLATGMGAAWAQTSAVALTAQERLDAIRHSLVETALQGATQVRTTQWLDAQGQLHDSSSFRSGMQVRGVRVLSYSRDSAGQAQAQLDMATPAQDLGRILSDKASGNKLGCESGSGRTLRHVVGLNTLFEAGTPVAVQRLIRQQISRQWLSVQDLSWRMQERNSTPAVMSVGQNPTGYEQALTSSNAAPPPWMATLRIRSETAPLKAWEQLAGLRPHHLVLTVDFTVAPSDSQDKQFQATNRLTLPLAQQEWAGPSLDETGSEQLRNQWQIWAQRLDQWMGCEPPQPKVTDRGKQNLHINAGSVAGVRAGDEWLLADPQSFPSRLVDTASASVLLAKVVEVTPHQARLTVLAGSSAQAIPSHWRAWPAESLNR
jgi:hypothetical protein